jgi:SAM-dependent methyltransferase
MKCPVQVAPLSLDPVSRTFGLDRGTPIDRYYIESFLGRNHQSIRGRVLEIGDSAYTRRFGGDRVSRSEVLHAVGGNRKATIVGDLCSGDGIPQSAFDCIILTQVLPFVLDVAPAIETCRRALRPSGVVLATVPGISQISRYDMDRWGDYWRFTDLSARKLFARAFGEDRVEVESFGNVLAANCFLQGLAMEELEPEQLDHNDRDYQLIITIKARRSSEP